LPREAESKPATPWWQDAEQLATKKWQPYPTEELSGKQRGYLKRLAHSLKPVVHIGQEGLPPKLLGEIRKQLLVHELIKVRWVGLSREEGNKKDQARQLATAVGAHFVQLLGQNILLYRRVDPSVPIAKDRTLLALPD